MNNQYQNNNFHPNLVKVYIALTITVIIQGLAIYFNFSSGNSVHFDVTTDLLIAMISFVISLVASLAFLVYLNYAKKRKILALLCFFIFLFFDYASNLAGASYMKYQDQQALKKAQEIAPQVVLVEKKSADQINLDPKADILSFKTPLDSSRSINKFVSYDKITQEFKEIEFFTGKELIFSSDKAKVALRKINKTIATEPEPDLNTFEIRQFGNNDYWEITKKDEIIRNISPEIFSSDDNYFIFSLSGARKSNSSQSVTTDDPYSTVQAKIGYIAIDLLTGQMEFYKDEDFNSKIGSFWPQYQNCSINDIAHKHYDPETLVCSKDNYSQKDLDIYKMPLYTYQGRNYQTGVRTDTSHLYRWDNTKNNYYIVLQSGGNADDPEAIFKVSKDQKNGNMILDTEHTVGAGQTGAFFVTKNNDIYFSYTLSDYFPTKHGLYIFNEKDGLKKLFESNGIWEMKLISEA